MDSHNLYEEYILVLYLMNGISISFKSCKGEEK